MIEKIEPYSDSEIAANDTLNKYDLFAAIVQNRMYPVKISPEDIFANSHKVKEWEALQLFQYNLFVFLDKQWFSVELEKDWS